MATWARALVFSVLFFAGNTLAASSALGGSGAFGRAATAGVDASECRGEVSGNLVYLWTTCPPHRDVIGDFPEFHAETLVENHGGDVGIDIVFLGDGYTEAELGKYRGQVGEVVDLLFGSEPLSAYRTYFNVHVVDVVSPESGVDLLREGIERETALDMGLDGEKVRFGGKIYAAGCQAPAGNSLRPRPDDIVIVLLNAERPARAVAHLAAGRWVAASMDALGTGPENAYLGFLELLTGRSDPEPGDVVVAIYAILTTQMGSGIPDPFYLERLWPFYPGYPARRVLDIPEGGTQEFSFRLLEPTTHSLEVEWFVDGKPVGAGPSYVLDAGGLERGLHEVVAWVRDPTPLVVDPEKRGKLCFEYRWPVSVGNRPPVVRVTGETTVFLGELVSLVVVAEDADGDRVEYGVFREGGLPEGVVFAPRGDVNGDGRVGAADVVEWMRRAGGAVALGEKERAEADFDMDGVLTETDRGVLLRLLFDEAGRGRLFLWEASEAGTHEFVFFGYGLEGREGDPGRDDHGRALRQAPPAVRPEGRAVRGVLLRRPRSLQREQASS
ncbi:MAG: hypothetical protein KatS3mg115_2685 [Candidatus Poribacteria bacterium]|nr:MAG: hypothetical protein KatS3mg115_2685 [Candidatus Poribacteria bacterium]